MAAITQLDRIDITFDTYEQARIDETARRLHDASRVSDADAAVWGAPRPGSLAAADLAAITEHVAFCAIIERAHRMTIDPAKTWGRTREQIADLGAAKAAARKRGAGARAVRATYGDEAARRITGHTIRH